MQTDPIADFLTRLRNAAAAKHQRVDVPVSKLKTEIARILKEEGYISTYKLVDENKTRKMLRVFLKYTPDRRSVITGLKRISRPGARAYLGAADIRPVVIRARTRARNALQPGDYAAAVRRNHRAEAHFAPGCARVSRRGGYSSRRGRSGHQHHDHAEGSDERPGGAQGQNGRRNTR